MEYIKQHVFTENTIGLYYLSPYVTVRDTGMGSLYILREDRHMEMELPNDRQQGLRLLEKLMRGISETELSESLLDDQGIEPQDWIASCLQGGVIE